MDDVAIGATRRDRARRVPCALARYLLLLLNDVRFVTFDALCSDWRC